MLCFWCPEHAFHYLSTYVGPKGLLCFLLHTGLRKSPLVSIKHRLAQPQSSPYIWVPILNTPPSKRAVLFCCTSLRPGTSHNELPHLRHCAQHCTWTPTLDAHIPGHEHVAAWVSSLDWGAAPAHSAPQPCSTSKRKRLRMVEPVPTSAADGGPS